MTKKVSLKAPLFIVIILLTFLSACSKQLIQPEINTGSDGKSSKAAISELSKIKFGKTLKLVRVMEGGVCKNKYHGVFSLFKLYASPDDISSIKKTQGSSIFTDFERQIQQFSMLALQHAVNLLDFNADQLSQTQLAKELSQIFSSSITQAISNFENDTALIIDVVPIQDSIIIYLDSCELSHAH